MMYCSANLQFQPPSSIDTVEGSSHEVFLIVVAALGVPFRISWMQLVVAAATAAAARSKAQQGGCILATGGFRFGVAGKTGRLT